MTKKRFPIESCKLNGHEFAKFELLAAAGGDGTVNVQRAWRMVANTGNPIQRMWGNLVLDLAGAKFSQRLALLLDHDVECRLGFSETVKVGAEGLIAEGQLLSNPEADQVLADSKQGFPWQASLMAVPAVVEELQPGAVASVNGRDVTGPLTIFRDWTVRELTLTVLGADQNTSCEAFASGQEVEAEVLMPKMIEVPEQNPATQSQALATKPAAPAPTQTGAAPAEPAPQRLAEDERKRVVGILEARDPSQQELADELIRTGVDLPAAVVKLNADLRERLSLANQRLRTEGTAPIGTNGAGGDGTGVRMPAQLREYAPNETECLQMWGASPRLRAEFVYPRETEEQGKARFLAYRRFVEKHLKGRDLALAFAGAGEKLGAETHLQPLTVRGVRGDYFLGLEARDNTWLRDIASVYDTDAPQEDYPFLGVVPKFVKYEGPRTVQTLNRGKLTVMNDDYEMTIQVEGKDWRRDKTGQIAGLVVQGGEAAAEKPIDMISALLNTGSTTSLAWDGVALFGSRSWGKSGTINNNLGTGDGLAGGATPTTAQQSTNIWTVLGRILSLKDDQGRPMHQRAQSFKIMIPPNLIQCTESALKDMFSSAGVTNALAGAVSRGRFKIEYIVNAGLTATDTFFMWRDDARVKPFVYQEEFLKAPYLLAEGSEFFQRTNKVEIGGHLAGGAAPGKYELIARAKLA